MNAPVPMLHGIANSPMSLFSNPLYKTLETRSIDRQKMKTQRDSIIYTNYGKFSFQANQKGSSTQEKTRAPIKLNSIYQMETKVVKKVRFEDIENEYFPEDQTRTFEEGPMLLQNSEFNIDHTQSPDKDAHNVLENLVRRAKAARPVIKIRE